jgi:hypothetical protein
MSLSLSDSIVYFPTKRITHVNHSYENMRRIKNSIIANKYQHAYINLTNFVVDELPIYNNIESIIKCAIQRDTKLSLELPNYKTLGGRLNPQLDNIVIKKYNKKEINIYKVYHINDNNSNYIYNSLSNDIRLNPKNIGVHIRLDNTAIDELSKNKFAQCCSLVLSNCYSYRPIRIIIEINSEEMFQRIKSSLEFHGMNMYYKIKLVRTPFCRINSNFGFNVLKIVPVDNNWINYFSGIFLEKDIH